MSQLLSTIQVSIRGIAQAVPLSLRILTLKLKINLSISEISSLQCEQIWLVK